MNTKTHILPLLSFLAALAGLVLLPVSLASATAALTATGLLALLLNDYGRQARPLAA